MYRLPSLTFSLIVPCLGLSLLSFFAARPGAAPAGLPSDDSVEVRQPKPAGHNPTRLILLNSQYGNYERCRQHLGLARTLGEEAKWRGRTQSAVRLYNQVADDTDPSAFALTPLPRHLRQE